ncbi:glycosyltransferase family 2 protein [Fibrivirga algicola]|uniref:Glycosyltransferase family 2 protein n=1 Tax=Fibrivirga algicola TaxID=2950420 RepID=A0ABX0QKJ3_9BACT|nr:glycosyltransferase family 2 protein [Fibrivirga algicola]NID11163.1 glycosyltransferase family 2 protein [Fibrivirga algicola]
MELSIVIPVYNSERTLTPLLERLEECLVGRAFEVVLVNDGSRDRSEWVCERLADRYANVRAVSLRRNFGEFNAVLCGLNYAVGQFVVIIDDDFQNPPDAILTLLEEAKTHEYDVVYSRYEQKQHHWLRNVGSDLTNALATYLLRKPNELYLSSFKLIRREVVDEIIRYKGPYPYIDGLIFRVTSNVGSVLVPHHSRQDGHSNYTIRKLISLFLTVLVGYSVLPLRVLTGIGMSLLGFSLWLGIILFVGHLTGWLVVRDWELACWVVTMLGGLQLVFVGILGEYVGRLSMTQSGMPPYVVKRTRGLLEEKTHD